MRKRSTAFGAGIGWIRAAIFAVLLASGSFAEPAAAGDFSGTVTGGTAEPPDAPGDPACDPEGSPQKGHADPVSPFTGKWFYRHLDLEVPGIFPIELVRRYDSQTTYQSPLGAGWAFPVEQSQEPMFRLLGTPAADKRHGLYDGGHVFPFSRMIKDTLDWLDKYLGAPR